MSGGCTIAKLIGGSFTGMQLHRRALVQNGRVHVEWLYCLQTALLFALAGPSMARFGVPKNVGWISHLNSTVPSVGSQCGLDLPLNCTLVARRS